MDFVKRKLLRRAAFTSSEGDIVYQSWLLQLPPARGIKKFLNRTHWRWAVLRYTEPQEGVLKMYTNASCTRMTLKIRITRKYKVESGMSFNPGSATNQLNMFSIRTDGQVYYLVAETQAEAEQWVLAICTTCGLDIPRVSKSPSPTEFLSDRPNLRPRAKSESLPTKSQLSSSEGKQITHKDSNYILLSECYVANEQRNDSKPTKEDNRLPTEMQPEENHFLSNQYLNYDHPRPINQRQRFLTSPDLRNISHNPHTVECPEDNFTSQYLEADCETGGMRKLLKDENMRPRVAPITVSSSAYDTPPTRVIPVLQQPDCKMLIANSKHEVLQETNANHPNNGVERARSEARQAALELEKTISQNSVTEILHGSVTPLSSEVFLPDFFPFDIHPDKPPPRPPKPPHLRYNANPWDGHMIQVDVACPIYDVVPKPRPVFNLNSPDHSDTCDCNFSTNNDCENQNDKGKNDLKRGPFLRHVSANLDIPSRQDSSATITISPNTRVPRPAGSSWSDYDRCLYDVPKASNCNNEFFGSSKEVITGVIRRRRPPTPPSQNLKHSIFPLDIDGMPAADYSNKKRMSLTDGKVQPLTQKQRISICNEVNYLDLAFTADEGECSPKPLTRETVYYSVDFIKTWAFNETRQNVEEIYRNT